jgi:type I restriction-modification system DNA methylase subunit
MESNKKQFKTLFDELSRKRSRGQLFSDFLEIASTTLHQLPYHSDELEKDEDFEKIEAKYFEAIKGYSNEELSLFSQMFALVLTGVTLQSDFVGELFMDLEISNDKVGQFFTPFVISRFNAKITMGDVAPQVKKKGQITISDPASGAGGMLIAAADEIDNQGFDPRMIACFDAIDISRDCFNMSYIQLSILGLQAVVHHGNTLSMEIWESRTTYQWKLFQNYLEKNHLSQKAIKLLDAIQQTEMNVSPTLQNVEPAIILSNKSGQLEMLF